MTSDSLAELKALIAELSPEDQRKIERQRSFLRGWLAGDASASIALSLHVAEEHVAALLKSSPAH